MFESNTTKYLLLSRPSVHGFVFFFFVFNDIVSATSHGGLGVGASPMAISALYIHKRSVDQVLQRLIEIHRKPSRNAGNRFSIKYYMTKRQRKRKRKLKKKKKSETTTEGTAPTER
jgi:hypothetical protein